MGSVHVKTTERYLSFELSLEECYTVYTTCVCQCSTPCVLACMEYD